MVRASEKELVAVVADVVIVPPFNSVVPVPFNVNLYEPIANVPPTETVTVPLTIIVPTAVFVPLELLRVKLVYVLAGICPFVPANSTVPAKLDVEVENAGFMVELVFSVPLLVRLLLHVKPKVDKSNVVKLGMVKPFVTEIVPQEVFVPDVLRNLSVE